MPALTEINNLVENFDPELVVYVEGPSDHKYLTQGILRKILEQYDRDRRIKLSINIPHSASGAQVSGCRAVIDHVQDQTSQGKLVFGILDRDALLREGHIDILLESDDAKFREKTTALLGENIWCLTRWEFENYLLCEADLLEQYIAYTPGQMRSIRPETEFLQEFFNHADLVTVMVAVNIELRSRAPSHPRLKDTFGKEEETRKELIEAIEKHLAELFNKEEINTLTALSSYHAKLSAFTAEEPQGTLGAWIKATRILDGKMLVARLFSGPRNSESALANIARHLGERIFSASCAAREFAEAIESFAKRLDQTLRQPRPTST